MASAHSPQSQFLCSICLDVFTEPVTTPCEHNYCKSCITDYWACSDFSQCPLCKVRFHRTPELQVNTEFRTMLELFKSTRAAGDDGSSPARPGEVACDLCQGTQRKALKSCLICVASYCDAHLAPHHTVQALKWHELIDPVWTLEDRVCKKHNKVMEFFCRKDQSCVCFVCLRDDHAMHETVPVEEELKERKTALRHTKRQVECTEIDGCKMVLRIQNSMMQSRQEVEEMKAETVKAVAAVVASIQTKKVKLIELLEEKQKAVEQRDEALIRQLWLEIAENRQTGVKLEDLLETKDDFRLLQGLPSASSTKHCFTEPKRLLQVESVRSAATKIEETVNEQMDSLINAVSLVDEDETVEESMHTQAEIFDDELGRIQEQYGTSMTLDPDTAHPSLIVSEDRKQVRYGGTKRKVPDNPTRFDALHFVLGDEGFSTRFYYEVTLTGQTGWEVGVARESISRNGVNFSLSPEKGCWTLGLYWGHLQANTNPPVNLLLLKELHTVGVFVDYEGGLVSFYDVDTRARIYDFKRCVFAEKKAFLTSLFRVYTVAKPRIYPIIRPSVDEGEAPLQIRPVGGAKRK